MGIINDRRPKDWSYIARFDKKDLSSFQQMIKQIQETHNTEIIDDFNQRCERYLQGETDPQIQSVTKSEDLAVNTGLQQCIDLILGTSSTRWSHIGVGVNGGLAPLTSQTTLGTETLPRIVLSTFGWAEAVGMRLLFGGITDQTTLYSVLELGVFNGTTGSTMLNRSIHAGSNNPGTTRTIADGLGNNVYTTPIIVSVVIEFCPMV